MTNERFAGQLRQHLYATADERVAHSQLASIVDQVALTSQHPTFVARLPWLQGGVGLSPATQLRWVLLLGLALVGLAVAGAVVVGGSVPQITADDATVAPSGCPAFLTQVEAPAAYAVDTHSLSLTVNVPASPAEPWLVQSGRFGLLPGSCAAPRGPGPIGAGEVTEVDSHACRLSAAAVNTPEDAIATVLIADGVDIVSQADVTLGGYPGTRFDLRIRDGLAACPNRQLPLVDGLMPFDPAVGSRLYLLDVDGTTLAVALYGYELWGPDARATGDDILASLQIAPRAPAGSSAPSDPPTADCVQFDRTNAYTAPAGQVSLTATVPGTANEPWTGERDHFGLLQAACSDYQGIGKIEASEVHLVDPAACERGTVEVHTTEEAIAAVSAAQGIEVTAKTAVTVAAHAGTRIDFTIPNTTTRCADNQIPLVDGVNPFDVDLDYTLYLIDIDGRTLAVALYAPSYWSPDLRAKVDGILASLEIDSSAQAAPGTPRDNRNGDCIEFHGTSTYTENAGPVLLTVDVPASADETWRGTQAGFSLTKATCFFGGPSIGGSIVRTVYPDACARAGTGVTVDTPAEAIAALAAMTGVDVSDPTDVTIDGYAGSRFEIAVPPGYGEAACWNGTDVVGDGRIDVEGRATTLIVLDVEGIPLALAINGIDDGDAAVTAQFDGILASMRIER